MRTEIMDKAKQHVNLYQSKIDRDGWSDDLCVDILTSFGAKMRIEVWDSIINEIMKSGNIRLDGWLVWCREQRKEELL